MTRSPDLPGWIFAIREVSNGFYRGEGKHDSGLEVAADGATPDEVIDACKRYAADISASLKRQSRS
jgi:hypothetical protein